MITIHNGAKFRFEMDRWLSSGMLLNKETGKYVYLRGDALYRFHDANNTACDKFPKDGDARYSWLWTNAGYHRLAS